MVDLVVVPHSDGLDEIRVYFEDVGAGRGYITMICWGAGWTAYFGGMGEDTIRMFVERVGADYLVNKMGNGSHLKQRKVDDNYLRKIVDAVKKHLKANPVATYTMGIDEGSGPDYTVYQLIKDGKVVDEGPDIIPDAGLSMSGTPFNMEPYHPKSQIHSCFPYVAPESSDASPLDISDMTMSMERSKDGGRDIRTAAKANHDAPVDVDKAVESLQRSFHGTRQGKRK